MHCVGLGKEEVRGGKGDVAGATDYEDGFGHVASWGLWRMSQGEEVGGVISGKMGDTRELETEGFVDLFILIHLSTNIKLR